MLYYNHSVLRFVFVFLLGALSAPLLFGFAGGDGSSDNPYQISTLKHLESVNDDLDAHYILVNDIDLGGVTYSGAVIATDRDSHFNGSFDGNEFAIKKLTIESGGTAGLFGYISGTALIKNLGIEDSNITRCGIVGVLAGQNNGTILNSFATGNVNQDGEHCGGLVGDNTGIISNSHFAGTVNGYGWVGGLAGSNRGVVAASYATGTVNGQHTVGGLAGL